MFSCPICKIKNISFIEKWKAHERKSRVCSDCQSKIFLSPWINAFFLTFNSFVWVGLIIYLIINLSWLAGAIFIGGIILLEVLRVLIVPLTKERKESRSD